MVFVFGVFALMPIIDMKEMGIGLAAAVLIDATIVRAVLLPATMKLLGEWNWYLPTWLEWLPDARARALGRGSPSSSSRSRSPRRRFDAPPTTRGPRKCRGPLRRYLRDGAIPRESPRTRRTPCYDEASAGVAQLAEHSPCKRAVEGSSPSSGSLFHSAAGAAGSAPVRQAGTARVAWCARILRLTRCSALSIVFVSQPSSSAMSSYDETVEVAAQRLGLERREPGAEAEDEALQLLGRDHADRRARRRPGPGAHRRGCTRRRRRSPAGVWLNET